MHLEPALDADARRQIVSAGQSAQVMESHPALFLLFHLAAAGLFLVWNQGRVNERLARAWRPLAPLVWGTVSGGKMWGTYRGLPVEARIITRPNRSAPYILYELTQPCDLPGGGWVLSLSGEKMRGDEFPSGGRSSFYIWSDDEEFKRRLRILRRVLYEIAGRRVTPGVKSLDEVCE